jgi:hypothetical protein
MALWLNHDATGPDVRIVERLEDQPPFVRLVSFRVNLQRPETAIRNGRDADT